MSQYDDNQRLENLEHIALGAMHERQAYQASEAQRRTVEVLADAATAKLPDGFDADAARAAFDEVVGEISNPFMESDSREQIHRDLAAGKTDSFAAKVKEYYDRRVPKAQPVELFERSYKENISNVESGDRSNPVLDDFEQGATDWLTDIRKAQKK